MVDNVQLYVLTAGHAFSAALLLGLGVFVYFQNRTRAINILFALMTFWSSLVSIHLAIGVNLHPSDFSEWWWSLSSIMVLLTASIVHFLLELLDKSKSWRYYIYATHGASIALVFASVFFPSWYVLSVSKVAYLNSFYLGGPLYTTAVLFFMLVPSVALFELVRQYIFGGIERARAVYYLFAFMIAFTFGPTLFFLPYRLPVDPFWSIFLGWYTFPIAYGIVVENLLEINIVVRRAFFYAVGIAVATGVIILIVLLNGMILREHPDIQFWLVPLVTGTMAVLVGRAFWIQAVEADHLKYEFITIAAHKLRTPLTRIKWEIAELIHDFDKDSKLYESLSHIDNANNRLIELTNVLLESAHTDDTTYNYTRSEVSLADLAQNALAKMEQIITSKNITVTKDIEPISAKLYGDLGRISSVVDVLIENAVMYTPAQGTVAIKIASDEASVHFAVADSGIGIDAKDIKRIFTSFYRTDRAKTADTEGVGIGLTIARNVIEKHGGKIGVQSEGEGKGATFWFTLPLGE